MAQNPDYKDKIRILNADLLGKHKRIGVSSYQGSGLQYGKGNYALRTDWLCADKLRAVLGKYYTVYDRPAAFPGQQSIKNFSLLDSTSHPWNWNQVKNSPLDFRFWQSTAAGPRYVIRLNNHKWNALAHNSNTIDFLRDVEYDDDIAGNPNWRFFLQGSLPTDLGVSGRFSGVTPVFQNPGPFTDNTFSYLKPSNIASGRRTSGMMIDVVSTYNFYADTTPPYEDAISTLPEALLPNFYCMESELRNTGSTPNNFDYIRQIKMSVPSRTAQGASLSVDFPLDEWFEQVTGVNGVPAGFTESTGDEFYSLYAASANSVANSSQMSNIYDDSAEFKNCVILCSDLEGLNKLAAGDTKSTGLINVPFYNTLTLGPDDDSMSPSSHGDLGNDNFFSRLKADQYNGQSEMFKSFMDILQMYIIQKIEAATPTPTGSPGYKKWKRARAPGPDGTLRREWTVENSPHIFSSDFSWNAFMGAHYSGTHARFDAQAAADRINRRSEHDTIDNLLLLRDYNSKADWVPGAAEEEFLLVDADVADCFPVFAANTNGEIAYPTRNFNSVLRGDSCYSEPILYKIDKSLIPPGGGTGQVVQTFYISARDGDWQQPLGGINYIDTQIKYGRKYTYDIKQIRLVYGNQYKYENLQLYYTNVPADQRQGIGRALGIYRDPGQSRWDGTSTGPNSSEVLDDIVKQLVDADAYPAGAVNPPSSPEQLGYFIFRPTEQAFGGSFTPGQVTLATDTMFQYVTLFNDGSTFIHSRIPNNTTTLVTFTGASGAQGAPIDRPAMTSTNVLDGIKLKLAGSTAGAGDQMVGVKLEYFANILERPAEGSIPVTPGGPQGPLPTPSPGGSVIPRAGGGAQVLGSGAPPRDPPPGII